jgi:hypothetical protein
MTVRGLNDNHNHDLKHLFKSAAISASNRPGPLRDFYGALVEKGMRPTMARHTLARTMAAITLTIWKKGVDFDAKQIASASRLSASGKRPLHLRRFSGGGRGMGGKRDCCPNTVVRG